MKHRIKLGEGIIIQYENINSGKHYLNLNYPKPIENELIDAIKLAEKDNQGAAEAAAAGGIRCAAPPQEYQIPLARLLNNLLMVMQDRESLESDSSEQRLSLRGAPETCIRQLKSRIGSGQRSFIR